MINDLRPPVIENYKYIDDTTISKVAKKHAHSTMQESVNYIQQWSVNNRLQLNNTKRKKLKIHFERGNLELPSIQVNGSDLDTAEHVKILGLTIISDLKWNQQVNNVVKKAKK